MGAVDVRLSEVDATASTQIFGEPAQQPLEHAGLDPALKSTVARLIRRIAARKICPWCAGAQNPQHAVENRSRRRERSAAVTAAANPLVARDEILDRLPLLVRQVHLDV
jgi:hypothetical protein